MVENICWWPQCTIRNWSQNITYYFPHFADCSYVDTVKVIEKLFDRANFWTVWRWPNSGPFIGIPVAAEASKLEEIQHQHGQLAKYLWPSHKKGSTGFFFLIAFQCLNLINERSRGSNLGQFILVDIFSICFPFSGSDTMPTIQLWLTCWRQASLAFREVQF